VAFQVRDLLALLAFGEEKSDATKLKLGSDLTLFASLKEARDPTSFPHRSPLCNLARLKIRVSEPISTGILHAKECDSEI